MEVSTRKQIDKKNQYKSQTDTLTDKKREVEAKLYFLIPWMPPFY